MMFYTFNQNNSGGRFHFRANAGISRYVIVEAADKQDAIYKAERIGLYWDGCAYGRDCSCCGDRWYQPWGDGDKVPSIYDKPLNGELELPYGGWMGNDPECFIHYQNGDVEAVWAGKRKQ